ncbi:alpha/beta fold hydrolase [Mycobacteroides abscessus]|uniref:alpha/beta fold hydrolase n=1 Tax=Mycobacteroides abscessus TaxID=36809 RepID=UPI0013905038|nr:alpha/beta fold hydrolase [Mycobacteroides abscessus]
MLLVSVIAVAVIGAAPSWASLGSMGWGACPAGETATSPDGTKAKCTTISVPVDYQDPSQGFYKLLVTALLPPNLEDVKNVILMNPGGPGGDVTGFLDSKNYPAPDKFYKDNALVAIQPRGLAGSTPLHCESAAACNEYVDQHPGYLKSLSTENIARDMDTFRKLAGLKKISYYGGSWGTELGAEYATLFPKYTDKMVLDSAVDPNKVGVMNGDQMRAVDARLYQWFSFVAEHDDKYQLGDTPLKVFNAWKAAMKAADKEAGNTKNFLQTLVLPGLLDPNDHFLPPAAQVNDLPQFLRPLSPVVLPLYNVFNQVWARASHVASNLVGTLLQAIMLPVAVVVGGFKLDNYKPLPAAITPTPTNIRNGIDASMYNRGGWEQYADQVSQMVNRGTPDSAFTIQSAKVGSDKNLVNALMGPAVVANDTKLRYVGGIHLQYLVPALIDLLKAEWYNFTGAPTRTTISAMQDATGNFQKFLGYVKTPGFTGVTLDTKPLVLQSDDDPATPAAGGHEMAKALDANLVTVEGGDHGVFRRNNDTVDHAVVEYFDTGKTGLVRAKQAPLPSELKAAPTVDAEEGTTQKTSTQTRVPAATTNFGTTTSTTATTTDKTVASTATTSTTEASAITSTTGKIATSIKTATSTTTAGTAGKTATTSTTTAGTAGKAATTSTTTASTAGKAATTSTTTAGTAGKAATTSTTTAGTAGKAATTSTTTASTAGKAATTSTTTASAAGKTGTSTATGSQSATKKDTDNSSR